MWCELVQEKKIMDAISIDNPAVFFIKNNYACYKFNVYISKKANNFIDEWKIFR